MKNRSLTGRAEAVKRMRTVLCLLLALIFTAASSVTGVLADEAGGYYSDTDELRGKNIGAITGASTGTFAENYFDGDVTITYLNSNADMALALQAGKIDAYVADALIAADLCEKYENQRILPTPVRESELGFFFRKDDAAAEELCSTMSDFILECRDDGTLDRLEEKWTGNDEEAKVIDIELTGENGTLTYACCSAIGTAFCYTKDTKLVGYEVELAYLFCEKYGYDLKLFDCDYSAMIPAVQSGKCDFGGTSTTITAERQEMVSFSEPSYTLDFVLVANADPVASGTSESGESQGFFAGIAASFQRTFLEESRWLLYLKGIGRTMLITVLSIVLGTALGMAVFLLCSKGNRIAVAVTDLFMWLLHGMPVVVLLMILYYIVFGKSKIDGLWISVLAFTLIFASAFISMLRQSYQSLDPGQQEAANALGYTQKQGLIRRLLPQMAHIFMPAYEAEVISLIKATAIVGYIAVQDLTKVGDLIRSLTFEAFFPLIMTAVLYFVLGGILTFIVKRITRLFDPKRRTREDILKGVNTHDRA